jgi:hypothetical protein
MRQIVYPDESAEPCALEYRIVFTEGPGRLAVVQIFDPDEWPQGPSKSFNVRDQVLNRILDVELKGLPLSKIRLVVSAGTVDAEYEIEVDIEDYVRRGNPYDATHSQVTSMRVRETISIRSDAIIASRTRVQTVHAAPKPLSAELTEAIA